MDVIDASIREFDSGRNRLELLVEETPTLDDLVFEERDNLYFAEQDGYVRYYYWDGPENTGGFGGQEFDITLVSERTVTLKGPYDSNPRAVRDRGFPAVVEVAISTDRDRWERGGGLVSAAITREKAHNIISDFSLSYLYTGSSNPHLQA